MEDVSDARCFAGATISAAKRIEALKELEKPETKAILLDLRLGARGLNLVCANRMIFLAPTWNLDVQAQAIKRVHRIGQTKPTKIEILVTRGTFEEDISERASNHRTDAEEQLYSRAMIEVIIPTEPPLTLRTHRLFIQKTKEIGLFPFGLCL